MQAEVVDADTQPHRTSGSIRWFLLVGCAAAAVHWSTVVLLVEHARMKPLGANVFGWLTALGVSFAGHHFRTFRGHGAKLHQAALRFIALSAGAFAINEAAYAVLLQWGGHRYDLVLVAVLVSVAFITYWLGRSWAFVRSP